jgi:DNA-binding CsgD family transcriptional regulator
MGVAAVNAEQFAARRALVADLTAQGWTAKRIGEHLGISARRVKYDRMVSGSARRQAPRLTDAEKRRAKRLLEGGASYYAAGRAIGRYGAVLRRLYPGYGHDVRAEREAAQQRREAVARMTQQRRTAAAIATALGVNERLVQRDRRTLGIAAPAGRRFTETEYVSAKRLLDDGASYFEVGRTFGRCPSTIERHLPGYRKRTPTESAQAAALGREMARLERKPNLIATQQPKGKAA